MRFRTEIRLIGPGRRPAQMLAAQEYDGHSSIHDGATAESLGLPGAPIEAPTHFSQFDPLAHLAFGDDWFVGGCVSAHFHAMVVQGEEVRPSLTVPENGPLARIAAEKGDGTPVLTGTASLGPEYGETELQTRLSRLGDPGSLQVVDRLEVGMKQGTLTTSVDFEEANGSGYPFSLAQKLELITECHPWYTPSEGVNSPWGRPILPLEMVSVLAHKQPAGWPVRTPSLGLFLDLEIRLLEGPVFVGQTYLLDREIVGLGQSRRTESYWTRTTLTDSTSGRPTAQVLLHSGVFKDSYPGYRRGTA